MSHTAHSQYGTDDRVKLPNLTDEEVNWQGLEDLYSINESLYECRPDYSPSPDNWANFQKDVDNMFALRHVLNKSNQTHKPDDSTLPELGSGAGGGGLEEGSGEESASASNVWPSLAPEAHPTTPAPNTAPSVLPTPTSTPRSTLERKLESVNELPEKLQGRPGGSVVAATSAGPRRDRLFFQSNTWAQQLEEMEGDVFSGNGLTELETRHDRLLRTHSLQSQHGFETDPQGLGLGLDPEEEEDIFKAQGYLPFYQQTVRPEVQTSTQGTPPPSQSVGLVLHALPLNMDYEGSGSLPPPSNQTL